MKKYLIVSGDSWTDKNFKSDIHRNLDTSYRKWPQILADKLDLDVINLGKSGQGNEYIFSSLVDRIVDIPRDRIGLVYAAWSKTERRDFSEDSPGGTTTRWYSKRYDNVGDQSYFIMKSHRYYYALQEICKSLNIPYRQCQMISQWEHFYREVNNDPEHMMGHLSHIDKNVIIRKITKSPYYNKIDPKYFVGWPGTPQVETSPGEYAGYAIQDQTNPFRLTELQVSEKDNHPNAEGHRLIAEYLYENL